ncbi:MAG: hypothetical protein CSA05_02995 [Bacteroidia bacterium]|nr:MAG: hypothetical protein CSA05_02995 [Bacteroidia bacterium]
MTEVIDTEVIILTGNYENDFKTGVWKTFDEDDGHLIAEHTYENSILNGAYKSYNEAKRINWQGNYKNGEKDGIWKRYNLAGELIQEIDYQLGREISNKIYK